MSKTTKIILLLLVAVTLGAGLDAQVDDSAPLLVAICNTDGLPSCAAPGLSLMDPPSPVACTGPQADWPKPASFASGHAAALPVPDFPPRC